MRQTLLRLAVASSVLALWSPVSNAQPAPSIAHLGEAVRVSGSTTISFVEQDIVVRTRPPRDERCPVGIPCDRPGTVAVHVDVSIKGERMGGGDLSLSGLALQSSGEQSRAFGNFFIGLRALNLGHNGEPVFLVVQSGPFADASTKAPVRLLRNPRVVQLDGEISLLDEQRGNVVTRSGDLVAVLRLEGGGATLFIEEPGTLRVLAELLIPDQITPGSKMLTASGLTIELRRRVMVLEDRRTDRVPSSPLAVRLTVRVSKPPPEVSSS